MKISTCLKKKVDFVRKNVLPQDWSHFYKINKSIDIRSYVKAADPPPLFLNFRVL